MSSVDMNDWSSLNVKRELDRELKLLKKSGIPEKSKKLILRYRDHRLAGGLSASRVKKEILCLRVACERYGLELDSIDGDKVNNFLAELELSGLKLNTVNDYKKSLRYFLQFIGEKNLAASIKMKEPRDNSLTRDDLLAVDEVLNLVSVSLNERDPALLMCHLDLGCRPDELLTLSVGDFVRDSWGIRVEIRRSKTFRRNPHLSFSIPYVLRWLESHPLKDSPEAPMWVDLNRFRNGVVTPVDNPAYNRILDRLFKRAGIEKKKRFSPYKFRHTSITMWSVVLTEQQLSKRSGHIPGSRHLRRYAKLVDTDTDRTILNEMGLLKDDSSEPEIKKLTPVSCQVCAEYNEPDRLRCWKCRSAMDQRKMIEEFGEEEIVESAMDDEMEGMMKDRIKKMIKEVLAEEKR